MNKSSVVIKQWDCPLRFFTLVNKRRKNSDDATLAFRNIKKVVASMAFIDTLTKSDTGVEKTEKEKKNLHRVP